MDSMGAWSAKDFPCLTICLSLVGGVFGLKTHVGLVKKRHETPSELTWYHLLQVTISYTITQHRLVSNWLRWLDAILTSLVLCVCTYKSPVEEDHLVAVIIHTPLMIHSKSHLYAEAYPMTAIPWGLYYSCWLNHPFKQQTCPSHPKSKLDHFPKDPG